MFMGWAVIDGDGEKANNALDKKLQLFENKLVTFITYFQQSKNVSIIFVHNIVIIGKTVSCVFSAS